MHRTCADGANRFLGPSVPEVSQPETEPSNIIRQLPDGRRDILRPSFLGSEHVSPPFPSKEKEQENDVLPYIIYTIRHKIARGCTSSPFLRKSGDPFQRKMILKNPYPAANSAENP